MFRTISIVLFIILLSSPVLAEECKSSNHPWQKARDIGYFGPEEASKFREVVSPDSDSNPQTPEFWAAWPKGTNSDKLLRSFQIGCTNLDCPQGGECASRCENLGFFTTTVHI